MQTTQRQTRKYRIHTKGYEMTMIYDVKWYRKNGQALTEMDMGVVSPKPATDGTYTVAKNTNWDGHYRCFSPDGQEISYDQLPWIARKKQQEENNRRFLDGWRDEIEEIREQLRAEDACGREFKSEPSIAVAVAEIRKAYHQLSMSGARSLFDEASK